MRNVDKYKQYMNFTNKEQFIKDVEAIINDPQTDFTKGPYGKTKEAEKKELLGCLMVGPLTMSEFLEEMGGKDLMGKHDHAKLAHAVQSKVGLVYQLRRTEIQWDADKKPRKIMYTNPELQARSVTKDRELSENDPQYTLWDKFFDFFGYKTDHAKQVDLYNATWQAIKDRKEELEYDANKAVNKDKVDDLIARGKEGQAARVAKLKAFAETEKKWEKLFLGEQDKSPVYKFGSGKLKLSGLSACMAMYTQKYGYEDLGKLQENSNLLDSVLKDDTKMEKFREVGKEFMELYQSKENTLSSEEREKFKLLDDFMFDKPRGNELTSEDKKLLSAIYDKNKNTEKIEITPYDDYNDTLNVDDKDLQNNYAYIKAKMEFEDVFKDKLKPFGKDTEGDKKRKWPIKTLINETKAYECMKEGKLKAAAKLLSTSYHAAATDEFIKAAEKELAIPPKTVVKEKENEIEVPEPEMEMGGGGM